MFSSLLSRMTYSLSVVSGKKVAVLGAGGGIGQPLSLLLKATPSTIKQLALYDICNMGMAVDLAHIPTPIEVRGYSGADSLSAALEGCDIVVIPAGVPRKPGMTRDDLFNINAGIIRDLAAACANVLGVTTLDIIRAETFIGELKNIDPSDVHVKVIGGHSGNTILPILSETETKEASKDEKAKIIQRIQYGGDEVIKAKNENGSATLSMAYAGNRFVQNFLTALDGKKEILDIAFIRIPEGSSTYPTKYFACPVEIGSKGISKVFPLPKLDDNEKEMLNIAVSELKASIEKGIKFASL